MESCSEAADRTYLALWWHLAPRWCSPHRLCGWGWPLESRLLSLCTLCWGPDLKTFKNKSYTAPHRSPHSSLIFGIIYECTPASGLLGSSCYLMPQMTKIEMKHQNQAIKLISYCPVKLIAMITLSELEVEQLELIPSQHRLSKWCHVVKKVSFKSIALSFLCEYEVSQSCRHWKIDEVEGYVTCGGNQVRRAFHGSQRRDPDSAGRSRTWWDFNTHTQRRGDFFSMWQKMLSENVHQLITK